MKLMNREDTQMALDLQRSVLRRAVANDDPEMAVKAAGIVAHLERLLRDGQLGRFKGFFTIREWDGTINVVQAHQDLHYPHDFVITYTNGERHRVAEDYWYGLKPAMFDPNYYG